MKYKKASRDTSHLGDKTRAAPAEHPNWREEVLGEDHRDGSYNFHGFARDSELLGSYPQHDDYGDESGPD